MNGSTGFAVLLLAGDRGVDDPIVMRTGASCKALAPVAGKAMIERVINALEHSHRVDSIMLSGPSPEVVSASPLLRSLIDNGRCQWRKNKSTPCLSVADALAQLPAGRPVLVTTADHALLTPDLVDAFISEAENQDADIVVGVAEYDLIKQAFPDAKRTVLKFRESGYCGCNLFAFFNPDAGQKVVALWRQAEQLRKQPVRLAWRILGPSLLLRYLLGRLTLSDALLVLSKRLSITIRPVVLADARAAVDVDKVADLELVEALLAREE